MATKKKMPQRRMPVLQYPKLIEKKYDARLVKLMKEFEALVIEMTIPRLPSLKASFDKVYRGDSAEIRMDEDFTDDVNKMVSSLLRNFGERLATFKKSIRQIGDETDRWNRDQLKRAVKESVGIDILSNDRGLDQVLDVWVRDNVKDIASMTSDQAHRIEKLVVDGFRNGLRHEEVAKGILDSFKSAADRTTLQATGMSAEARAKLLARDQIGKLNSDVTKTRQTKLGLRRYRWRTSMDEKVRDSHKELENELFYWDPDDGPTPPEGHPGMPINCRCYAEPDFSDLLKSQSG